MEIESWPIDRPVPYPKNPRKIPQSAIDKVAASIEAFGWRQPIVVDRGGVIVVGHSRLLAARKLGLATVPVHVAIDLSEAQTRAYRIADNRSNEEASWDANLLRLELAEIGELGDLTAFDPEELERFGPERDKLQEPEAQIGKADELRAKWGTETGQLWQIGQNRIVCGDCRDEAVVGRLWAEGGPKLRMVWTDPPYGVNYAAKNAYLNRSDRGNRVQTPIENDRLTADETGTVFKRALEVAKQFAEAGAVCYATVPAGPLLVYFIQALTAAGFGYHAQLMWVKHQFVIGRADYHHRFEPILYGWLPDAAHYFVEDRTQDDVFEIDKPQASEFHPTTKPVELIARMVANSSLPGEVVFDPFCGSGSTLLAAHQLDRIGYGVELSPAYVAVTLERFAALGVEAKLSGRDAAAHEDAEVVLTRQGGESETMKSA